MRWGRSATRGATSLRGPGTKNVDLGLHKTFATGGGTRMQVRIEAFNVFNWVNLGTPNTTQNSRTSAASRDMRRIFATRDAGRAAAVVLAMADTNHGDGAAIAGLFAAVATPTHEDGRIDGATFDRIVDFLVEAGVSGICIAGATGEYPHFESADRKAGHPPRGRAPAAWLRAARRHRRSIDAARHRAWRNRASKPAAVRCCCRCRCSSAIEQEDLEAFSTLRHRARCARPACSTTCRTSPTGSRPRPSSACCATKNSSSGSRTAAGRPRTSRRSRTRGTASRWTLLVGDDRLLAPGRAVGLGWRHLRRGRVLPGAARRALPQPRRWPGRRVGAPAGTARRADHAARRRFPRRGGFASVSRRAGSTPDRCRCPRRPHASSRSRRSASGCRPGFVATTWIGSHANSAQPDAEIGCCPVAEFGVRSCFLQALSLFQ